MNREPDWIDALDEYGFNTIVDELVWHLREGRFPDSVVRYSQPAGFAFQLGPNQGMFFPFSEEALDPFWGEAVEIVRGFPQLSAFTFRSEEIDTSSP